MLSNGSLIDTTAASWLAGLKPDFVQLSLEGSEAAHDAIRGKRDYQRVVQALRCLNSADVPTMVSFTAHGNNYREFPAVVQAAQECGAMRFGLIAGSAGETAAVNGVLSAGETRDFFAIMDMMRRSANDGIFPKTEVAMHRALQFLVAGEDPIRARPAGDFLP